jgi:hypothetical protein
LNDTVAEGTGVHPVRGQRCAIRKSLVRGRSGESYAAEVATGSVVVGRP